MSEATDGPVVRLDAYPRVYLAGDRPTLEPTAREVPEPAEALVLALLGEKRPGVAFELPDDPGFREADPVPLIVGPDNGPASGYGASARRGSLLMTDDRIGRAWAARHNKRPTFDHATRMFVFKRSGSPKSVVLPGDVSGRMGRVEAESAGSCSGRWGGRSRGTEFIREGMGVSPRPSAPRPTRGLPSIPGGRRTPTRPG